MRSSGREDHNRNRFSSLIFPYLLLAICLFLLASPGSAADNNSNSDLAQITVSNVTLDPGVFSSYDTGILSVELTNTGTDNVPITLATLYDSNIRLESKDYDTTVWIGPKDKRTFTFTLTAACPEGKYYPVLSVNSRNMGMRYPLYLQVDNSPLILSVLEKPDTFSPGKKEQVQIQVSNPRRNTVREAHLVVNGTGIDSVPSDMFMGNIEGGTNKQVTFSITPSQETNLTFTLQYSNGDNPHSIDLSIPVSFGNDKMQADPDVSNLVVKQDNGIYHITGDVTNAGLTNANSVVVTSGGKATPVYPYKSYVVGSLKPDDFSSFDLTFNASSTKEIPILVSYKDKDGNDFNRSFDLDLTIRDPGSPKNKSDDSTLVIGVIVVIAVIIGGFYLYRRRKSSDVR